MMNKEGHGGLRAEGRGGLGVSGDGGTGCIEGFGGLREGWPSKGTTSI